MKTRVAVRDEFEGDGSNVFILNSTLETDFAEVDNYDPNLYSIIAVWLDGVLIIGTKIVADAASNNLTITDSTIDTNGKIIWVDYETTSVDGFSDSHGGASQVFAGFPNGYMSQMLFTPRFDKARGDKVAQYGALSTPGSVADEATGVVTFDSAGEDRYFTSMDLFFYLDADFEDSGTPKPNPKIDPWIWLISLIVGGTNILDGTDHVIYASWATLDTIPGTDRHYFKVTIDFNFIVSKTEQVSFTFKNKTNYILEPLTAVARAIKFVN